MYVHYGCHHIAPEGWLNFDASLTLRWERLPLLGRLYTKNPSRFPPNVRFGDIVKGLPVPPASCAGVYASHVLEHLTLDGFHKALDNTKAMLRGGGIFRLVVPDLEWAAREYLRRLDAGDHTASEFFLDETRLGCRTRKRGMAAFVHEWLRTSAHLWMWDEQSLKRALQQHGFLHVRRCQPGDCEDPMFRLVEDPQRFENAIALETRT